MARRRFRWHLLPYLVVLPVTVAAAMAVIGSGLLRQLDQREVQRRVRLLAHVFEQQLDLPLEPQSAEALTERCDRFARVTATRLTLVSADGRVLCDTAPATDEPLGPEIQAALAGRPGVDVRYVAADRRQQVMVAVPIRRQGVIAGAVRVAAPGGDGESGIEQLVWAAAAAAALSCLAAWLLSRWAAGPVVRSWEAIRREFADVAEGVSPRPVSLDGPAEEAAAVDALNQMLARMQARLEALRQRNDEQEAVLASMVEGVLAVDRDERVISLNQAAARLLGTNLAEVQGRSLPEVIRNTDLRRFAASALGARRAVEGDIVLRAATEVTLQAHGTALRDAAGRTIGAVIVLNDVSRLRQLENMRRDFAANVSHELRTPITSIKGFVETLLDGALRNPDDAERFLRIVARQAERLNNIIEDLLSLSKLERAAETAGIDLSRGPIRDVLQGARHDCEALAAQRQVQVDVDCDEELEARINAPLLQQAVTNLLDNAIKYSETSGRIELLGRWADHEVLILVRDHGCGIAPEHLPRLFERFYRVDKARSRKLGGTGLGLAIVKHIVIAHRGTVSVESVPGQGSTFTIHLPPPV